MQVQSCGIAPGISRVSLCTHMTPLYAIASKALNPLHDTITHSPMERQQPHDSCPESKAQAPPPLKHTLLFVIAYLPCQVLQQISIKLTHKHMLQTVDKCLTMDKSWMADVLSPTGHCMDTCKDMCAHPRAPVLVLVLLTPTIPAPCSRALATASCVAACSTTMPYPWLPFMTLTCMGHYIVNWESVGGGG